jgi:hypothetical protein
MKDIPTPTSRRILSRILSPSDITDDGTITIDIPAPAQLLCVQLWHGTPTLWYEACVGAATKPYTLRVYTTQQELSPEPQVHLGTVVFEDGLTVLHFYQDITVYTPA